MTLSQIKKLRDFINNTVTYAILCVFGITMLFPFLWMFSTSLKESSQVFTASLDLWPKPFVFRNYLDAWKVIPFGKFYINSILVALCVTVGQTITSSMAAYAFARLKFPGRDKLFLGYLATMMVPYMVTTIPVFILIKELNWLDTYKALILPAMFTAYGTFMLRQFFMTLPSELEDAAKIDGCSFWRIYWQIILPLSKPALATLATFTFLANWQNFIWPLIVTSSEDMKTLPVGLSYFQDLYTTNWTLLMAAAIIVLIPALLVFIFNQRFITKGIALSGLKG
ncbi:MAG: carbohydrate ABC transporter permease [Elusimicrobia bacterium]|nr:carbohydrate ABC transporter permease [Candidatus Liberimonas magnetica]